MYNNKLIDRLDKYLIKSISYFVMIDGGGPHGNAFNLSVTEATETC